MLHCTPILEHTAFRLFVAIITGSFGGWVFYQLKLPLPWLLGALSTTFIASLSGLPVEIKSGLRKYLVVILGLILGSSFKPEVIERVEEWTPTLIAAAGYLVIVALVAQLYCRHIMRMDQITAAFSGMPGGLSEMVILGEENGADARALTLTHAIRVASVLLAIPFFLTYWTGLDGRTLPTVEEIWSIQEAFIFVAIAIAGVIIGKVIHMPAYYLTGPMLISAAVHLSGTITSERPPEVSIIIQVAMGSALGTRFFGVSLSEVGRLMLLAAGLAFTMMCVTILSAIALSAATGSSFEALVLALSPGGFAEMALAALSMNIDPAFVTTHHGLRLLIIVLAAPVILSYWIKRTM